MESQEFFQISSPPIGDLVRHSLARFSFKIDDFRIWDSHRLRRAYYLTEAARQLL